MNLYYQVFRHLLHAMGLLLLLLSLLLTHLITQLTVHVITVKLPSTPTIDILYASNWLVSLVHALITTVVGLVLLHESDLVLMEVELPLLYPYGWLSLGYWLYDLVSLANRQAGAYCQGAESSTAGGEPSEVVAWNGRPPPGGDNLLVDGRAQH